jgi:hypothetical protein
LLILLNFGPSPISDNRVARLQALTDAASRPRAAHRTTVRAVLCFIRFISIHAVIDRKFCAAANSSS